MNIYTVAAEVIIARKYASFSGKDTVVYFPCDRFVLEVFKVYSFNDVMVRVFGYHNTKKDHLSADELYYALDLVKAYYNNPTFMPNDMVVVREILLLMAKQVIPPWFDSKAWDVICRSIEWKEQAVCWYKSDTSKDLLFVFDSFGFTELKKNDYYQLEEFEY